MVCEAHTDLRSMTIISTDREASTEYARNGLVLMTVNFSKDRREHRRLALVSFHKKQGQRMNTLDSKRRQKAAQDTNLWYIRSTYFAQLIRRIDPFGIQPYTAVRSQEHPER